MIRFSVVYVSDFGNLQISSSGKVQNNICSYPVTLRQERGGGIQEKIFISKLINLSKCLTLGFLSYNVAFRIVDIFAPFPICGDIFSQKSCRYAVCVSVFFSEMLVAASRSGES